MCFVFSHRSEQSKLTNSSRLKVLEKREEQLETVFDEARNKLSGITKDEAKYTKALGGLILEVNVTINLIPQSLFEILYFTSDYLFNLIYTGIIFSFGN